MKELNKAMLGAALLVTVLAAGACGACQTPTPTPTPTPVRDAAVVVDSGVDGGVVTDGGKYAFCCAQMEDDSPYCPEAVEAVLEAGLVYVPALCNVCGLGCLTY